MSYYTLETVQDRDIPVKDNIVAENGAKNLIRK